MVTADERSSIFHTSASESSESSSLIDKMESLIIHKSSVFVRFEELFPPSSPSMGE
jgi:hypothetical protein